MSKESPTIELSAPQIVGGALAAASAAVASSWLGVAGTVLGAVVVSVIATVGTALYSHSLERSSKVLRETLPIERATARPPRRPRPRGATAAGSSPSRSGRRWPALVVTATATCVLALALLTAFEALVGKPASTLTGSGDGDGGGGTTVSRLVSDESPDAAEDTPRPDGEAPTPRSTAPEPGPTTPSSPEVPAATPTSGATPTPPAATPSTPPTTTAPLVEPSQMVR